MDELISQNKIILSKKYSSGTVYMLEMPGDMLVVVAFGKNKETLCARTFIYTESLKKSVMKESRHYFKQVQECLYQKKLEKIEQLDFD